MSSGLIKYGGLASAVLALAGVAALVGFKADRPAWSSEVMLVQAQVQDINRLATQEALDSNQMRLYQNLREQRAVIDSGKPVPDYLLKEQVALEAKKRKLEKRIKQ